MNSCQSSTTEVRLKKRHRKYRHDDQRGKPIFHIFGALAEFERDIIRERTLAGLQAARARGRVGGRPKALDSKKANIAQALYKDKNNAISDIRKTLNISRATLYRYIKVK